MKYYEKIKFNLKEIQSSFIDVNPERTTIIPKLENMFK